MSTNQLTRAEQEELIMKEIARKDLTFWCKVIMWKRELWIWDGRYRDVIVKVSNSSWSNIYLCWKWDKRHFDFTKSEWRKNSWIIEIIWHEITLEDILLRADKNKKPYFYECWEIVICPKNTYIYIPRLLWKPLSEQTSETVKALADLILTIKGDENL